MTKLKQARKHTPTEDYAAYVDEIKRVARTGGQPSPQNIADLCDDHDRLKGENDRMGKAMRDIREKVDEEWTVTPTEEDWDGLLADIKRITRAARKAVEA